MVDLEEEKPEVRDVNKTRVKKMILHNDVPINCCAIAVLGLPCSGKSSTLEALLRNTIVQGGKHIIKAEDTSFKLYDICAFGSYPYKPDSFRWSHTTKRLAPVHFFLSDLTQKSVLRDFTYDFCDSSNGDPVFDEQQLDEHLNFLFAECKNVHASIKKGDINAMIPRREGLSLINCFDVGLSKANFDLLPLFAYCFKKMVRFSFLSLDSDKNLDCVPTLDAHEKYNGLPEKHQIMRSFPKINYLLRLATGGYDVESQREAFKTVMVATHTNKSDHHAVLKNVKSKVTSQPIAKKVIDSEWVEANPSDPQSMKQLQWCIEKKITKNNHLHMTIPLKWVFLRSLISCLTLPSDNSNILMPFKFFLDFGNKLEMNEEEVERFLLMFTDFASLLYCPLYKPLQEYVITDIEGFMKLLDILYHPKPEHDADEYMRKYGIITYQAATKILNGITEPFMQILMSLGFAAQLSCDQVEIGKTTRLECGSYFMPNIRQGSFHTDPPSTGSLLVYFDSSTNKSENEASLSKYILARYPHSKVKLIASEEVNYTRLRVELEQNMSFELHIIYHGKLFELLLTNLQMYDRDRQKFKTTLTTIVEGCCKCMIKSNFGKGVDFSLKFKCIQGNSNYHNAVCRIDNQVDCQHCESELESAEKTNRDLWLAAVQKVCSLIIQIKIWFMCSH